jgi:hypothetical protein
MYTDSGIKTFTANVALAQYRRVKFSSGELVYAAAADTDWIGVTTRPAFAADDPVSVWTRTKEGTIICEALADDAIAIGETVYGAADGKVTGTGTVIVGVACTAVTTAGGYLEVLPSWTTLLGTLARSSLTQDDLKPYAVPLNELRVHDDFDAFLPETAATDDLGFIEGTFLTSAPAVRTLDFKTTTTTAYARFQFVVPAEYVDGQTVTLRVNAGAATTVSDGTLTLDAEVVRVAAPSTDICATAAQSINSLTAANKDFTITPTNVVAGDILDVRLTIAGSDTATGTAVLGQINSVTLLLDIKG